MENLFFYIISPLLIATALGVVACRNPIHSGLYLVGNLLGVACIYAYLDAHFLSAVQIIVYAGAIVVLVLFVLMLLNTKVEKRTKRETWIVTFGIGLGVVFLLLVIPVIWNYFSLFDSRSLLKSNANNILLEGSVKNIGEILYTKYLFLFEAASVLIMSALVGAVMLAHRSKRSS